MTTEGLTPCPQCGHLTENLVFCDACGAVLAEQQEPPPRPEPRGPGYPVPPGSDGIDLTEPVRAGDAATTETAKPAPALFRGSPFVWGIILVAAFVAAGFAVYFLFGANAPPPSTEELIRRNEALLVPLQRLLGAPVPEMTKQQAALLAELEMRKMELAAAQTANSDDTAARVAMLREYRNQVEALAKTDPATLHTSATQMGADVLLLPLRSALAKAKVGPQTDTNPVDAGRGATVELPGTPPSSTSSIASLPILDAARRHTEGFSRRAAMAKGEIVPLDEDSYDEEVKPSPDLWVVIFAAPWSAAAKDLNPALQRMARDFAGKVKFGLVDTDVEKILTAHYSISGMLTILVMKNGEILHRFREPQTANELRRLLTERSAR